MLGGSVYTIEKNTEALVVGSRETELEINANIAKNMVMSRDEYAGRSRNIKTDHSSLEWAEELMYLGTTLMNTILLRKKIRAD
jgi:hypothetical protein